MLHCTNIKRYTKFCEMLRNLMKFGEATLVKFSMLNINIPLKVIKIYLLSDPNHQCSAWVRLKCLQDSDVFSLR